MTKQLHTADFAFETPDGPVFVCVNCYAVHQLKSSNAIAILNRGVNEDCNSGAVYIRAGRVVLSAFVDGDLVHCFPERPNG